MTECHGCEIEVPIIFDYEEQERYRQVENGLCLPFSGHYGGFFDLSSHYVLPDNYLVLCHDCCVVLFEAFPRVADRFRGYGLHSFEGERCCEFGWSRDN